MVEDAPVDPTVANDDTATQTPPEPKKYPDLDPENWNLRQFYHYKLKEWIIYGVDYKKLMSTGSIEQSQDDDEFGFSFTNINLQMEVDQDPDCLNIYRFLFKLMPPDQWSEDSDFKFKFGFMNPANLIDTKLFGKCIYHSQGLNEHSVYYKKVDLESDDDPEMLEQGDAETNKDFEIR